MKPVERYGWIANYLGEHRNRGGVDVLNADFVNEYAEATGAKVEYTPYGANRCPQLARDLKAMTDQYILKRTRTGIPYDMRGLGFPLWVWNYQVRFPR